MTENKMEKQFKDLVDDIKFAEETKLQDSNWARFEARGYARAKQEELEWLFPSNKEEYTLNIDERIKQLKKLRELANEKGVV